MAAATALPDAIIWPPPAAPTPAHPAIIYPGYPDATPPPDATAMADAVAMADADTDTDTNTAATLAWLRAAAGITLPWPQAILRAIGQWTRPAETVAGQRWHYVIGGEALDWLTLAHRLSTAIPDAIPPSELENLLFHGQLPRSIDPETFRRLIGTYRYTAHLNYQYGVVVEEALQLAIEESVRKNHLAQCYGDSAAVMHETYRHLYGDTEAALYREFSADAGGQWTDDAGTLSLTGYCEFTYWLFKRRIRKWHPARIASDTRRGLDQLRELRGADADGSGIGAPPMPEWPQRSRPVPLLAGSAAAR